MKSRSNRSKAARARKGRRVGGDAALRTGSRAPHAFMPPTLEASIGAEVRRLRKSLDLTVAELGVAAGISAGMLSKIENGAISPSLATLEALAKALNVPISALFVETEERRDCSFVKDGRGVRIERRGTKAGHLYDLLGHSLRGEIAVEPYLITLRKNAMPCLTVSGCISARARAASTACASIRPSSARMPAFIARSPCHAS